MESSIIVTPGKGESIWDRFSHTPGKVDNGDNGDVACDSYHKMDKDISLIKDMAVSSQMRSRRDPNRKKNSIRGQGCVIFM